MGAVRQRRRAGGGLHPLRAFFRMPGARGFGALLTITKFTLVPESVLLGRSLGEIEREFDVAVVALRAAADGRFLLHPPDEARLAAGDRFVVSATVDALARIARLTPPTREISRYIAGRWPLVSG